MGFPLPDETDGDSSNDKPFFSYGLFKPGQLGYFRIEEMVGDYQSAITEGNILTRDGIPIFDNKSSNEVNGMILSFTDNKSAESAYEKIADVEPDRQYEWTVCTATPERESDSGSSGEVTANILRGITPRYGTSELTEPTWDGSTDPLFTDALEVVDNTLEQGLEYEWENKKSFFRLQMAYLLLWSAIERYISLRYGLRGTKGKVKPYKKRNALAAEDAFQDGIKDEDVIPDHRDGHVLYRTDRPQVSCKLSRENAEDTIGYYYQVRSNLTHRGKSAPMEFDLVKDSTEELLTIFRDYVLESAFEHPRAV